MEINFFPNWLLSRLPLPVEKRLDVALLFSNLIALAVLPLLRFIPHFCLAQRVLGVPCPGCGVIHAVTAVFRFDLTAAWHANPAGIAVAAMLVFQVTARLAVVLAGASGSRVALLSRYCPSTVLASLILMWGLRIVSGGLNGGH